MGHRKAAVNTLTSIGELRKQHLALSRKGGTGSDDDKVLLQTRRGCFQG